jgi:hypothetical protein
MATHLPIIADTYLWTVNYKVGTVPMANVLCVSKPTSSAAIVNGNVWSAWSAANSFKTIQSNTVDYLNTVCLPLDGSGLADIADRSTQHGGTTSPIVGPQVCAIFTFRTGLRGRSYRGRMYLGGVNNTLIGTPATLWSSTGMTGFNAAITAWQATNVTNGITHEVLSRFLGVATPVLQIVARQYIGTQRDRAESQIP